MNKDKIRELLKREANKEKIRELLKLAVEVEEVINDIYHPKSYVNKNIKRIIREIKALDIG